MATTAPFAVRTDAVNTQISEAYFADDIKLWVAPNVFPMVKMDNEASIVRGINRGDLARLEMVERASGAKAARSGYNLTSQTVTAQHFALAKPSGMKEIADQDAVYNLEDSDARYLNEQWLMRMEVNFAGVAFVPGVWGTTAGPTLPWENPVSVPVNDIDNAKNVIRRASMSKVPDSWFKLLVGTNAWHWLKQNPDLDAKIGGVQVAHLTRDIVASLFEIGEVVVCDSVRNTAIEGAADVGADIFTANDALLMVVNPNPGRNTVSAGYTWVWPRKGQGFSNMGHRIRSRIDMDDDAHITEIDAHFIHARMDTRYGYYFQAAVT